MATAVFQGVMQEGGILVSFQDTTGGDGLSGTAIFGMSDFELTDQLLACAVANHNIDPRRVYATGCSAGGLFSTAMASNRSSYLAAAAPNSGGSSGFLTWQNMHTPALMTIHGAPESTSSALIFHKAVRLLTWRSKREADSSSTAITVVVTVAAAVSRETSGSFSKPIRSA
jgi:poly(3-hydroxybutyrate) depolymerase